MKTIKILANILILVVSFHACEQEVVGANSVTLREAFQAAKKRSETLIDQEEQIKQIEEKYDQAMSAVLPDLNATASITRQAKPSGSETIFQQTQRLLKASLVQPVFRGFKELAFLKASSYQKEAQEKLKAEAIKLLFNDVSQNYMTILSLENDLKNLYVQVESYNKRIKHLQYRVRIGRSRPTELMTMESVLANVQAQIAQDEGALQIARDTFAFLTALPADSKLKNEFANFKIASLESYMQNKNSRTDVLAANLRVSVANETVKYNSRQHWPSIDFTGNYYFYRDGAPKDVPWDIGLSLTLPIYDGSLVRSKTREAESQKVQAENNLQLTQRKAETEIRSYHKAVNTDLLQKEAYKKAFEISEKNLERMQKEFHVGLASNLEVLQALSSRDDAKRNLDKTDYLARMDYIKLTLASEKNEILNSEH